MGPYAMRIQSEIDANPTLQFLWDYLSQPPPPGRCRARIGYIEYFKNANPSTRTLEQAELSGILATINKNATTLNGRIIGSTLIVEDIEPSQIEEIGEFFSTEPKFFASYICTRYGNIEHHAPPPYVTALPSETARKESAHIHYQRVIKLQSPSALPQGRLITCTNVCRAVRPLPPLSNLDLGIARSCFSILRKSFGSGFWLCLILVDKTTANLFPESTPTSYSPMPPICQRSLHGTFRGTMSSTSISKPRPIKDSSMNHDVFDILMGSAIFASNPKVSLPSMLSLIYHPLQIALQEWSTYSMMMHRYVKHYEYSLQNVRLKMREDDIHELQRWRRRAFQSLQKLFATQLFVEYWNSKEQDIEPGVWMIRDIQHISNAIAHHGRSLETMIPVVTSIFQIADMRRSTDEASHLKQLTYLALIFIPLSYVSSLFSMSERVAPWSRDFWLYFAVAIPMCCFVLGASWLMPTLSSYLLSRKYR